MGFVREVIGAKPTPQQVQLLEAITKTDHVTARSGHGIGKTTCLSWIILWWMSTRPYAKVPTTAPTAHQLEDILWGELIRWHRKMKPEYRDKFEHTSDRFFHKDYKESWFAVARTARPERPEALQGFHGENLLFVIDEPSGIADEIFEVAEGALTGPGNKCVMCGNPTRLSGFFYDSFHSDRGRWTPLNFSSLDSPLVDKSYAKRMKKKYGAHSSVFQVRVLGEFPSQEEDQLIGIDILEAASSRISPEAGDIIWGLDVARFGADETVLVKRYGETIKEIKGLRKHNLMAVTGWVVREIEDTPEPERPAFIYVDTIGLGAGVADRLRELKYPARDVNVSESASEKEKFMNLRAELWWKFRDWLQSGLGVIPKDDELIAQAASVKYAFDSSGRIRIEGKDEMKKRGRPSPDRADAIMLTMRHRSGEGQGQVDMTWSQAIDWDSADGLHPSCPTIFGGGGDW